MVVSANRYSILIVNRWRIYVRRGESAVFFLVLKTKVGGEGGS